MLPPLRIQLNLVETTESPAPAAPSDPDGSVARELDLRVAIFKTHLEQSYAFTNAALDRYKTAATTVQTASTALVVLYTGALALVFGEGEENLPARGLLTPAFLALSVILSSIYLAYQRPRLSRQPDFQQVAGSSTKIATAALENYRKRVVALVTARLWTLHSAVIALTVGIATAAAPFTSPGTAAATPVPTWPPLPTGDSAAALKLYEAQLAEATKLREAAMGAHHEFYTDVDRAWLIAGIVLLVLVFAPWFGPKLKRAVTRSATAT